MAPHGGGIEPGTADIADAVAGHCHAYYGFAGIKMRGNRVLHIPSHRFNEPCGLAMAQAAQSVLTIHGCHGAKPVIWVGGRDRATGDRIIAALQRAGLPAQRCEKPGLRGMHPDNLCNRGLRRAGVQLEFSFGLRHKMFADFKMRSKGDATPLFHRIVDAIALSIQNPC